MQKLSEYLKEKVPDIHLENCKKVIKAYRDYMSQEHGKYCTICLVPFTLEWQLEWQIQQQPIDCQICCKEHLKYRGCFDTELVRRELGIKESDLPNLNIYE